MNKQEEFNALSGLFQTYLSSLAQEIEGISRLAIKDDELDQYILELNCFYYRDFSRRFYPQFKKDLEELLNRVYYIHNNEDSIRSQVLEHLKQLAIYSNTLEEVIYKLEEKAGMIADEQQQRLISKQRTLVEMLYSMKELEQILSKWQHDLSYVQSVLSDESFMKAISAYPYLGYYTILLFKRPQKGKRGIRQHMTDLELSLNLLIKIQQDRSMSDAQLEKAFKNISRLAVQESLMKLNPLSSIYHRLLMSQLKAGQRREMMQTAHQYEDYLSSLLYLLKLGLLADTDHSLDLLCDASRILEISPEILNDLQKAVQGASEELKQLLNDLESSINACYSNYSKGLQEWLDSFMNELKHYEQTSLTAMPSLYSMLEQVKKSCLTLREQIQWWDEIEEAGQNYDRLLQEAMDNTEQIHLLLKENEEIAGKALAPRNLQRRYEGFQIRIENWKAEIGKALPDDIQSILPGKMLQSLPSSEAAGTVLKSEGYFYRIQVDQEHCIVWPRITISSGEDLK